MKTSVKSENHHGTQPIRVLQHNIISRYENTNTDFLRISMEQVAKYGLQPGISYYIYEEPLDFSNELFNSQTPFVDENKKIALHETFLSYIWTMCYSLLVLYDEAVAKPMQNAQQRKEVNKINKKLIEEAQELFQYGKSLIRVYTEWDKEKLPNPELFSKDEEFYILRVNGIFVHTLNFILCHEFAHVEKKHVDKVQTRKVESYERKIFEKEADDRAIELMLQGKDGKNDQTLELGILMGFVTMLYFKNDTDGGENHPDTDSRIKNYLEKLNPSFDMPIWGTAALALKLWDDQFNLNFGWPSKVNDFKELFYRALEQVEERKSTY